MPGENPGFENYWKEMMSKGKPEDEDLKDAFAAIRAEDTSLAPPFAVPDRQSTFEPDSWKLRPAIPVLGTGVAILCILSLFLINEKQDASAIEFDELSDLISRELFTASTGNWTAPSDFLLEYDELFTP